MKQLHIIIFIIIILSFKLQSQDLPHHMTEEEILNWPAFYQSALLDSRIVSPPPGPVRAPGEWEELMAISITWTSYQSILREIVKHAQLECKVIINCSDSNTVKTYLTSGGVPLTSNLIFNIVPFNSVWIRDYGSQSVYQNDVGDLFMIDWKYNRSNRPLDDVLPASHAALLNLPFYEMNASPYLLVATGGNLMHDGFGTAMSSKLILNENTALTEAQINTLASQFWGTSRYIKFDVLPYDGIHHIDMHMKLLDEETILLGEYPPGISDGPQIEANLQYLLANYNSVFGTPYNVVRIPMPPNQAGTSWPSTGAYYRTYTNGVFINKTFIYPTYFEQYDTTAERIYRETLPGYKLVGIDSDNGTNPIISASGSIHCITNNIHVTNPLLISHKKLENTDNSGPYPVAALIKHASGIFSATLFHTNDTTQGFSATSMTLTNVTNNTWTGFIPQYPAGSTVYYYIGATSVSNKTQVRPITAPHGFWKFDISVFAEQVEYVKNATISLENPFPNPARAITCVPVQSNTATWSKLGLYDINGRLVQQLHEGDLKTGINHFFFNAMDMRAGVYFLKLETHSGLQTKKVLVFGY
jgi:agmatine deiminase